MTTTEEGRTSPSSRSRLAIEHAALHDQAHLTNCRDCASQISLDRNQVSEQTWLDGSQAVV